VADPLDTSVVVAGAGIAGLAAAVALQQRGYSVRVLEARADTADAVRGAGISIWPNALAALDQLGLGDDVRAAGGRITAGAVRWHDGTWIRRPSAQRLVTALGEPLVVIQRGRLLDILAGALTPDTIRTGVGVTTLQSSADGVRLQLSDVSAVDAAALIGADGTHSVVARHLNGRLVNSYVGYTAWRGIADYALAPELAGETMGPGIEVGHVPMGQELTYWFATERLPEGHRPPGGELAYLRHTLAGWADPVPAILAATAPAQVLRNDLYDRTPARQWSRGPVLVVGDAAHPMRPHLGQGGCQALEDAAILGAFVDRCGSLATAFAEFAEFRRPRITGLVRESALIGRIVNLRPALLGAAATRATRLMPEALLTWHLGAVAAGSAFVLP
jgi:2-polyprenyl-6-methoxyphenol hydroxylase-like FAD-dependent oxidoreductase